VRQRTRQKTREGHRWLKAGRKGPRSQGHLNLAFMRKDLGAMPRACGTYVTNEGGKGREEENDRRKGRGERRKGKGQGTDVCS